MSGTLAAQPGQSQLERPCPLAAWWTIISPTWGAGESRVLHLGFKSNFGLIQLQMLGSANMIIFGLQTLNDIRHNHNFRCHRVNEGERGREREWKKERERERERATAKVQCDIQHCLSAVFFFCPQSYIFSVFSVRLICCQTRGAFANRADSRN